MSIITLLSRTQFADRVYPPPSSTDIEASWSWLCDLPHCNIIAIRSCSPVSLSPIAASCLDHYPHYTHYTHYHSDPRTPTENTNRAICPRCPPRHRHQAASPPRWWARNRHLPNRVRKCTGDRDQVRRTIIASVHRIR